MIELSHVTKTFAPRSGPSARALDDVSFRVAAGEAVGLAGPGGAGKSTLIALVLGFVRPTTGSVRIDGIEPRRFVEREGVAYLPQRVALPSLWRVTDALTRLAMLSGVHPSRTRERVDAALDEVGLAAERATRVCRLTADARQRLGIAQALLSGGRVVVLDDPMNGLEPESAARLRDLLDRLRAPDRAILIASRDAAALERITDRVTVIDRGRVRRTGASRTVTPADVEALFHLVLQQGAEHVLAVFPSAISIGRSTFAVRVTGLGQLNRGLRELLERGALLASVVPAHAPGEAHVFAATHEVMT